MKTVLYFDVPAYFSCGTYFLNCKEYLPKIWISSQILYVDYMKNSTTNQQSLHSHYRLEKKKKISTLSEENFFQTNSLKLK